MARSKVLLIDNDVLSHFAATGNLDKLSDILSRHTIFIHEVVLKEAEKFKKVPSRYTDIQNWMQRKGIQVLHFPKGFSSPQVRDFYKLGKEYRVLDPGERAIIACARNGGEIVVSSNFRDVKNYCEENHIEYIGTFDILTIAMMKGIWSEADCNKFISEAIRINGARFPKTVIGGYTPTRELGEYV